MTQCYRLHYAPDNASLIIRLALEELGVPYDTALVDRAAQAQRAPDYLRLNPMGLIPVLETPDGPIFETGAILLWLADRHGALVPGADAPGRGAALKWLFFVSNTLHPALRMTFYPDAHTDGDADEQARLRAHAQGRIKDYLDKLDVAAGDHPDLFNGDRPGVIALYLGPLLRWMALYPEGQTAWFDLHDWPRLRALALGLERRASTAAAMQAEGLGPQPFSDPQPADPPEGSAT